MPTRKSFFLLVFFLFFFFFFPADVYSQVVVNEFAAITEGNSQDPDWVELYNPTGELISLQNWLIRDRTDTNKIELSGDICPEGFRTFTFSNRLNQDGDQIRLFDDSSNLSDQIEYFSEDIPEHVQGQSTGLDPSGSSNWVVFDDPSPENTVCQPSATPTNPTPSLSPTLTPTVTASPTPTSTQDTATWRINEVKDERGETLAQVKIYVDDQYVHHWAPEDLTFGNGIFCDEDKNVSCEFGQHTVGLEKNGYQQWQETKDIQAEGFYESDPVMASVLPTSTPTAVSTPTSSPTLSPTPSPTLQASPSPSLKPAFSPSVASSQGEVLSGSESKKSGFFSLGKKDQQTSPENEKSWDFLPIIFIGGGLVLLGSAFGILRFEKRRKEEKGK